VGDKTCAVRLRLSSVARSCISDPHFEFELFITGITHYPGVWTLFIRLSRLLRDSFYLIFLGIFVILVCIIKTMTVISFAYSLSLICLSRFHLLLEFDEAKRSCRKRLDGHNRRRRKPQPDTMSSGSFMTSQQGILCFCSAS
jgi:hypothetical protein